jgi:hypothetical protein
MKFLWISLVLIALCLDASNAEGGGIFVAECDTSMFDGLLDYAMIQYSPMDGDGKYK